MKIKIRRKIHSCVYPGSLIQQNHGEAPTEQHGILKWDVDNFTSEFIPIHNDFGYATFGVADGVIEEAPINVPNKVRARIFTKDTTISQTKNIITDLNKKHQIISLSVIPTGLGISTGQIGQANVNDVNNVSNQEQLLKTWLKNNIDDITKVQTNEIIEINRKLNTALPEKEILTGIEWSLKYFSFSNMFSYGEDNYLDFESLQGSVGLFGANHSGKSTFLEALMFTMFDKCSRASRGVDILNVAKNEFNSKLCFSYDGQDYFIERKGKRQKKRTNVKIDANFYTIDSNGVKQDLSGIDRKDTYKRIKKYLGEHDIFVNTLMSLQNNTSGFVYQKQAERKAFLADLLGIAIFEQLRVLASNEIKESEVLLKEFKKTNFENILANIEVQLEVDKKAALGAKDLLVKTKESIKILNDEIIKNTQTLKDVPDEKLDEDALLKQKKQYEQNIVNEESLKKRLLIKQQEIEVQLVNLTGIANKAKDVPKQYEESIEVQTEQHEIFNKWNRADINVKAMGSTSDKLLKLEYDSNCKYCMNNIFVKDAIEVKSKLEKKQEELVILKIELDKADNKLLEYKDIKKKNKTYTELIKKIDVLKMSRGKVETALVQKDLNILTTKNNLLGVQVKLDLYEKVKDYIIFNESVEEVIKLKKLESLRAERLQTSQESESTKLGKTIAVHEERMINYRKSMEDMESIENKLIVFKYYLKAVHKDGIPKLLIQEAIPIIEAKINNILELITDFSVKFDMDDSSIIASIYYDNENFWPIELTSGFEKFVISLAIRIALTQISNLSYSNFMIIDEGWGNFDAENLGNVGKIFEYLENNFKFLLIVSHIDTLKDAVNNMIEIDMSSGESYINNMAV